MSEKSIVFPPQYFTPTFCYKIESDDDVNHESKVAILCRTVAKMEVTAVLVYKISPYHIDVVAYDVQTWDMNYRADDVGDRYFAATIKSDGCSHFFFGDKARDDGYIHICGYETALLLKATVAAAFVIAKQSIPTWNDSSAATVADDIGPYALHLL